MVNDENINKGKLDKIINEMTDVVEKSQDEIFHINEAAIQERNKLKKELQETRSKAIKYMNRVDKLNEKVKMFKQKLSVVSQRFDVYTEEDIRKVYNETHRLQTELVVAEKEEKVLRQKRDELERRIVQIGSTIKYAENISQKVSVVLNYLYEDFSHVQEVLQNAEEKHHLSIKIIEAQEMERKRLSREIHDGPAQMLANILIRSEIADLSLKKGEIEKTFEDIKSIRSNIQDSLEEVRRIIYNLRPMSLDDLGLFPVLEKHVNTMADYYDIDIDLKILGNKRRLNANYEVAIFRLVQEALQNAISHSMSKKIYVILEMTSEQINIIIRDEGIGFDMKEKSGDNSFGIIGMKERIELLEGKLMIDSKEGKGTTIRMNIPYKR
ncbi:MAG TPA: sensor histidine kinase [Pseudogracilibacillus sp.]|nr:sensor histidine kinase [Pseudogracilibacillus sp.]